MKVITHDGVHHTDEVGAVAVLLLAGFIQHNMLEVVRTRDPKQIAEAEFVIDVGMEYNHEVKRYDHHQKGGAGERSNGVPYASFGLIWKHYSHMVVEPTLRWVIPEHILNQVDFHQLVTKVADLVDSALVQGVDARDCGVKTHLGINGASPYTISDSISAFNKPWYMDSEFRGTEHFKAAVSYMSVVIKNEVVSAAGSALAELYISKLLENQIENKILILDQFVPWGNFVMQSCPRALYVIFPDLSGTFRVQAVPVGPGKESFELKAPFPQNWRGKSPQELVSLTSCEDVMFVHNAGFIMGCKTLDGAKHCAEMAVQLHEIQQSLK